MLRGWKTHHENWVRAQLSQSVSGVGFAELEVVCKALLATTPLASSALIAIPPSHKVAANGLTAAAELHLRIGLMQAPEVADFLDRFVSTDSDFGNRLRAGFVSEYERLYQARYRGDALFFALLDAVSSRTDSPQIRRAAALAVLAHLFQLCEVFSS